MEDLAPLAYDNFVASLACQAEYDAQARTELRHGVLMVCLGTACPAAPFNAAIRLEQVDADDAIDNALDWFGERNRGFAFCTHGENDLDLVQQAERRGLLLCGTLPVMALTQTPERCVGTGLKLEAVATPEQLRTFAAVAAQAFSVSAVPSAAVHQAFSRFDCLAASDMKLFLARDVDKLIGCGALLFRANSVGLYWVAVHPELCGRGYGSGLVSSLVERAATEQQSPIVLQSSPAAERLYRRLGFLDIARLRFHCCPFPRRLPWCQRTHRRPASTACA